jgi:hypothetical protein
MKKIGFRINFGAIYKKKEQENNIVLIKITVFRPVNKKTSLLIAGKPDRVSPFLLLQQRTHI